MSEPNRLPSPPLKALGPKPPFAPFWPRLGAFAVDLVVIYFAGYTLEMALRPPLMMLGPWLPLLSTLAAFAYFWLGNGPVGQGATLGKAILNLHVVDDRGKPLGAVPALRRALLQFPIAVAAPAIFVLREGAGLDSPGTAALSNLLAMLSMTVTFSLAYTVVTHPRKRGWHDLLAGSYVALDPTPAEFGLTIAAGQTPEEKSRIRSQRLMAGLFMAVLAVVMLVQWAMGALDPESRRRAEFLSAIRRENFVPGHRIEGAILPSPGVKESLERRIDEVLAKPPAGLENETSGTLRAMVLEDGETAIFVMSRRRGELAKSEMENPEIRAGVEKLRAGWRAVWEGLGPAPAGTEPPPAKRFAAVLADPFRFITFTLGADHQIVFKGPADPAEGPLTAEWIEIEKKDQGGRTETTVRREANPASPSGGDGDTSGSLAAAPASGADDAGTTPGMKTGRR